MIKVFSVSLKQISALDFKNQRSSQLNLSMDHFLTLFLHLKPLTQITTSVLEDSLDTSKKLKLKSLPLPGFLASTDISLEMLQQLS